MTNNPAQGLLPCPFCEGDAEVERLNSQSDFYKIICVTSGCRGQQCAWYSGLSKAINAWNKRAPTNSVVRHSLRECADLVEIMHSQLSRVTGEHTIYKPMLDRAKQALALLDSGSVG